MDFVCLACGKGFVSFFMGCVFCFGGYWRGCCFCGSFVALCF